MNGRRLSRSLRGFTLAELLTIVAIIGILAALAFSVVGSIRIQAASIQSIGNLRQLGLAYVSFSAENEGKIPPAACNLRNPSDFGEYAYARSWDYWLLPYLGFKAGWKYGNLTDANTPSGPAVEKLFLHPRDKNTSPKIGTRRTYASNLFNTPIAQNIQGVPIRWMRFSYLPNLSQRILLTEFPYTSARIGHSANAGVTPGLQISKTAGQPDLNPGGKFNYLFMDGHVESLALADTYTAEDNYPAEDGGPKPPAGRGAVNLWANPNGASCPCGGGR